MRRALLVLVLCAACSANDTAPQPGNLTLSLPSSGGNDGAVVLVISGGPVTLVTPLQGSQAATSADGEGTHVMIVGNLTAGAIATIAVPDVSRATAYVATVEQVSDRSTFALLDPVRYRVVITR
jgi:hypothetical protein